MYTIHRLSSPLFPILKLKKALKKALNRKGKNLVASILKLCSHSWSWHRFFPSLLLLSRNKRWEGLSLWCSCAIRRNSSYAARLIFVFLPYFLPFRLLVRWLLWALFSAHCVRIAPDPMNLAGSVQGHRASLLSFRGCYLLGD
jgi:hypothetical protein